MALFSTPIDVSAVLAFPEVVPGDVAAVLQLVSGFSPAVPAVWASDGVTANSAAQAAAMN
ncbi:hypothetical protein [Bradyrhizobium sp. G127]|jgi:hypothetical protein|uniref:hypothetical protein n=1 Tax=Bradyrhizobium sp. G127 TaxID=2904800 RepID=UPI001F2AB610|nr:hypothetical protein [Bradyrhizobium sp. G127]MCF2523125.1 hypothetical protein [Bradyrhizobium sp. G127]